MAVRWLATVPDSHPLSSDSSPFLTIPAKSQVSRSRPGLDVAPFSELSHRGMDGSHAMSGAVGSPLELHRRRVRKVWFLKGNLRCVVYYPKEAMDARQNQQPVTLSAHLELQAGCSKEQILTQMRDRLV